MGWAEALTLFLFVCRGKGGGERRIVDRSNWGGGSGFDNDLNSWWWLVGVRGQPEMWVGCGGRAPLIISHSRISVRGPSRTFRSAKSFGTIQHRMYHEVLAASISSRRS